jgi:hypothetical protein
MAIFQDINSITEVYTKAEADAAFGGGGGASRDNYVLVKTVADLPTPVGGVITLANNTAYEINGTIALGTDRIVLGTNCTVFGVNNFEDVITNTTGDLFTATNSDFEIKALVLEASGGNIFNITGNGTNIARVDSIILQNSNSIGSINGGYAQFVLTNSLAVNSQGGLSFSGVNGNFYIKDNIFANGAVGAKTYIDYSAGTIDTMIIESNRFNLIASEVAINVVEAAVTRSSIDIKNNIVDGVGTGLTGINANDTGINIPSRSNQGIAGLFQSKLTLTLDSYSGGVTYPSFGAIPNTITVGNASDLEPNATTIIGVLEVNIAYSLNGAGTSMYFDLAEYNNAAYTQVVGSETQVDFAALNTFAEYYVRRSAEFTLPQNSAYRPRIARHTGAGNPTTYLNSAKLIIKAF